jgi:hypothetical protein
MICKAENLNYGKNCVHAAYMQIFLTAAGIRVVQKTFYENFPSISSICAPTFLLHVPSSLHCFVLAAAIMKRLKILIRHQ